MHIIHMKWRPSRWRSHNRKCDVAFDRYVVEVTTCGACQCYKFCGTDFYRKRFQVPAEIRHEGGETLRTSFSRDLAKCVNNLTFILWSEVGKIDLSDLESKDQSEKSPLILYNANVHASGYWWLSWTSTTAPKARQLKVGAPSSHRFYSCIWLQLYNSRFLVITHQIHKLLVKIKEFWREL